MSLFDRILKKPVDYVEGRVGEVREQLRDDAADVLTVMGIYLMIALFAGVCLLLVSLALAVGIATWVGIGWGYAIVGLIYFLVAAWIYTYYRNPENKRRLHDRIHRAIGPSGAGAKDRQFREPSGSEEADIFQQE